MYVYRVVDFEENELFLNVDIVRPLYINQVTIIINYLPLL